MWSPQTQGLTLSVTIRVTLWPCAGLCSEKEKIMSKYETNATNWALWNEFVNTDANMSKELFDALTVEQKIALQVEMFGPEETN
jgi:hypothetical protein